MPYAVPYILTAVKFFFNLNLFFKFIYFNWRIIALQYCVGFCHVSTWTSHMHTYIPSFFMFLNIYLLIYLLHRVLVMAYGIFFVAAPRLSCSVACGILIEPTSPALQSKFLTTGPPGKSQEKGFKL